jgi:hypothetical protein
MMKDHISDKAPWFVAKSYGYGAGLPIAWQGWMLMMLYVGAVAGMGLLSKMPHTSARIAAFVLLLIITAAFIAVCRQRTQGGWKWRWGSKA